MTEFQFTHPVWGATYQEYPKYPKNRFQFTHPVWGATLVASSLASACLFQFTHPVWGATAYSLLIRPPTKVSIHAPRVGCDGKVGAIESPTTGFNSRTPCGVRLLVYHLEILLLLFQFTHPVWGATKR